MEPTGLMESPGCAGYGLVYLSLNAYKVSDSEQENSKPIWWKSEFVAI